MEQIRKEKKVIFKRNVDVIETMLWIEFLKEKEKKRGVSHLSLVFIQPDLVLPDWQNKLQA